MTIEKLKKRLCDQAYHKTERKERFSPEVCAACTSPCAPGKELCKALGMERVAQPSEWPILRSDDGMIRLHDMCRGYNRRSVVQV